jgi:hypothetical protein
MDTPILFKGVMHEKTIPLDEQSFLRGGYRVTMHLIQEPEEALRLSAGSWADMTPEDVAEYG